MRVPRVEQLALPSEYGEPSRLLDWEDVRARLEDAKHYWLATVRRDGRPHVVPLDGLWLDDRWWFGGSERTVWQGILRANPYVTLHLEDADAAVVLDGMCRLETPSREQAEMLGAASKRKYGFAVPVEVYLRGVWAFDPVLAVAWTDIGKDATRFVFDT